MRAKEPFVFSTASSVVRIGNESAACLTELEHGITQCSDASIFHHTFQSLGHHHFLQEGFSNDFAQWALAACNRPMLAERLASIDIRDYVNLADLRNDLRQMVGEYCKENPREASQGAFEIFYFCETIEETVPLGREAWTLKEFHDGLGGLSHAAIQFHLLTSRLRLHLQTSDFSRWISKELGCKSLALKIDQIDLYTNTLDSARDSIVRLVELELGR